MATIQPVQSVCGGLRVAAAAATQQSFYWKLNTAILSDPGFVPAFAMHWQPIAAQFEHFPGGAAAWWEQCAKPAAVAFCSAPSLLQFVLERPIHIDFLCVHWSWLWMLMIGLQRRAVAAAYVPLTALRQRASPFGWASRFLMVNCLEFSIMLLRAVMVALPG
jgi:hypothetical protein